jgi:hypothetical protein
MARAIAPISTSVWNALPNGVTTDARCSASIER